MIMSYKGYFRPRNPAKYRGDPSNVIYRSLWELKLMRFLDDHPEVIAWGSEEIVIPYKSPVDGRTHRYFPDFIVKKRGKDGITETLIIEVKPKAQTIEPRVQKKATKKYINEVMTWGVNQAKWKAAESYCADRKWKFQLMTEKELGIS
jgi:hypothetical protein